MWMRRKKFFESHPKCYPIKVEEIHANMILVVAFFQVKDQ
jgi:hypothetical protein